MSAHWRYLDSLPTLPNLFVHAALRRKVTGTELPDIGLRCWTSVDTQKLAQYREVCGFSENSLLPPTYLHVLALNLQMQLMTAKDFPFPLLGLIHLSNRIRIHRPLGGVSKVYVGVQATHLRPHAKGATFDLITLVEDSLGTLWEEESTMLCRDVKIEGDVGAESESESEPVPAPMTEVARWQAPQDIGRRYAKVSGDYNPIHLSAPSARLFGFPQAIAHGMWLKARALAFLTNHLPASNLHVQVQFHKPVRLPTELILSASAAGSHGQFRVEGPQGLVHMVGSWKPVDD
jgi:acyl dehydratase